MKLTRTDLSCLATIVVSAGVGVAAFGPQNLVHVESISVVETDWDQEPMTVILPSGERVDFDPGALREGSVEFRRDDDRRRRRPDRDKRRRRRPHETGVEGAAPGFVPFGELDSRISDRSRRQAEGSTPIRDEMIRLRVAEPIVIRGTDSRPLGQPIIYVDGVRVHEMPDLNPDDIERIEVLKGPAAADFLGEEASAGVIQIFLKGEDAPNPGG